ncbi:tRNA 2-thiouridine(34) synthase MnmA [Dermatophilus congolensis]|uniref:tRNA 2-thiouridine(34) synthase MnmA n=1 Tax=Dermatophilus congolensis TaxID=1863 RepID=UPI001AAFD7D2|nr:tRNA 2-thiouridine(34) synthase MnmA [Dermatophilus congolensis]MBO3142174.1 tRNA 2-thiouridine(34) synthase MnmA [Dermatophilus congolensis]MBO3151166.1 tRNA 2-thiouridine(34) synthase MnmA [Dermatophilus congolensis]MBO3161833.1 tRNA 2-thiouridine(34) synthase MnmA [Dermatophilus congolensis]MBO3162449.1 tRNA 2-thiouridine(34) synthase MnmA [Dermatophilus congolensis]MBO3176006.1 tRNA 2-thiouridine(34) synthase MnmA [Dermatophilus congolensis]
MSRIVAAMSGGVDSAVAAARMVQAGHDVIGVHMALSSNAATLRESARGCCTLEDASDARRVADKLGIPYYVWDFAEEFRNDVIEDFVTEYAAGRTPNPCLRCNEKIKFSALLERALALGFDGVATGHYARVIEPGDPENTTGERELHRAVDHAKDQSYVLGVLDAEQLAASWFPLGDTTKPVIRQEAARHGFSVAKKPDSHDICFIADGDTRAYLAARLGSEPGPITEPDGTIVGEHAGAYAYTIGQRRGLHLQRPAADGRPRYVIGTDPTSNTVTIGPEELLRIDRIDIDHLRWSSARPTGEAHLGVQLRAHGREYPVTVTVPATDETTLTLHLQEPVRGVAPGQSAVLYDGPRVVGSGTISATGRSNRTN